MAGSTATWTPSSGPPRTIPAISWPPMIGVSIRESPMPPSSYQWRSDPQRPTAVISTRLSPDPTAGIGSLASRMSRAPWNRAVMLVSVMTPVNRAGRGVRE